MSSYFFSSSDSPTSMASILNPPDQWISSSTATAPITLHPIHHDYRPTSIRSTVPQATSITPQESRILSLPGQLDNLELHDILNSPSSFSPLGGCAAKATIGAGNETSFSQQKLQCSIPTLTQQDYPALSPGLFPSFSHMVTQRPAQTTRSLDIMSQFDASDEDSMSSPGGTARKRPGYALDPQERRVHPPRQRKRRVQLRESHTFGHHSDRSFRGLPSYRGQRNHYELFDCFDNCKQDRYGIRGFRRRANFLAHLRTCHGQDVPRGGYLLLDTWPLPSTNETGRQMPMERDAMRLEVELPIVIEKNSARLKEERPIVLKPSSTQPKELLSMTVPPEHSVHSTEEQKLRLSIRNIGGTKQVGAKKQVGQDGNSTGTTPGTTCNKSIPRKRSLGGSESNKGTPDYSNEDESKAQPKSKRRLIKQEPPRLYICPFYRKDPEDPEFRTGGCLVKCRTKGIKTDKLKEHIRRIHTKPAQCLKCGRRGDIGEIRDHRRDVECREKMPITKVDNQTLLKDQEITNQKRITWHTLFVLLFPDHRPEPPIGAEYFDYECPPSLQNIELNQDAHVENTDVLEDSDSQAMAKGVFEPPPPFEKIGQNLAAQLEMRNILESFLRWWSSEYPKIIASNAYSSGSRAETVGAAILMAMISSHPFQNSSLNTSTQPLTAPDHALQPSINSGAAPIAAFTRPDPNIATLNITPISNLAPNHLENLPSDLRQGYSGGNNNVVVPESASDTTDPLELFLNGSLADWDRYVDNGFFDEIAT